MVTLHVDLGQIIIASLITIIGYLVKSEVASFKHRLDQHDRMLFKLVGDVQRLIGLTAVFKGERENDKG